MARTVERSSEVRYSAECLSTLQYDLERQKAREKAKITRMRQTSALSYLYGVLALISRRPKVKHKSPDNGNVRPGRGILRGQGSVSQRIPRSRLGREAALSACACSILDRPTFSVLYLVAADTKAGTWDYRCSPIG